MASPDPTDHAFRPNLAGLPARALMNAALEAAESAIPWPAGFERLGLLGSGGMGEVHLARDLSLGREVAIKLVHPDFTGEPVFLERLEREARLMSAISHPGIVAIHRFERLDGDGAAIVMEYIEGGNLRDWMRRSGSALPIADALRLTCETAAAIHAAHQCGIVHRDLKPENILLTAEGRAKVTDFGLAAPLDPAAPRLTLSGTTAGTADYMAPERHQANDSDPRGDIYSLGVILYEILTNTLPRGNFDTPHAIRKSIPKNVSDAVMRALKNNPAQRFSNMADFAVALDRRPTSRAPLLLIPAFVLLAAAYHSTIPVKHTPPTAPALTPAPPPSPITAIMVPDTAWKNLLPSANPTSHTLSGNWSKEPAALLSNSAICILKLADEMPDSYDVRLTFTRLEGSHSIALFFQTPRGTGSIDIDGWGHHLAGVQSLDGTDLRQGNAFSFLIENGRSYQLIARIRPHFITVSIDGIEKITTPIQGRALGIVPPWAWNPAEKPAALAIGSYQSATRFTAIEWRPVPADAVTE